MDRTGTAMPKKMVDNRQHIFVFGSNRRGIMGMGSAREALNKYGAVWGKGVGHHGNSYAIPTKDENIRTMPLEAIEPFVKEFIQYANNHPELVFDVVAIGQGLAGYKSHQISPMFDDAPENVKFIDNWRPPVEKKE